MRPNSLPSRLGLSVEGLYQNIVESPADPVAVNLVLLSFLFRLLTVAVVLRGDCDFLDDDEREEITKKRQVDGGGLSDLCVRARFDSPLIRVCLFGWRGPGVTLRIGPSSRVILDASYVDDQLRIGKVRVRVPRAMREATKRRANKVLLSDENVQTILPYAKSLLPTPIPFLTS